MPKTTGMTVRLPAQVKARLEKLAKSTDRSKAYLASRASEQCRDVQEWQVEAIEHAIREANSPDAVFHDPGVQTTLKTLIAKRRGTE